MDYAGSGHSKYLLANTLRVQTCSGCSDPQYNMSPCIQVQYAMTFISLITVNGGVEEGGSLYYKLDGGKAFLSFQSQFFPLLYFIRPMLLMVLTEVPMK